VKQVARFVAEHFTSNVEPLGYKAFLVAYDREGCVVYKEALDAVLPPEMSAVVISANPEKDDERMRRYELSEEDEKLLRKAFVKRDDRGSEGSERQLII
jgi:type I restriction enzyme R subunit